MSYVLLWEAEEKEEKQSASDEEDSLSFVIYWRANPEFFQIKCLKNKANV